MKVVVVGAGIIGASVAYQLAKAGAQVTVIDGAGVAAGATGRSFGWINASFHADAAHFRLRAESMAAYHRLIEHMWPTRRSRPWPLTRKAWPRPHRWRRH